jgi:hypothetical protein
MPDLIPQKHGGALFSRPPAGASSKGASFKALRKAAYARMAAALPEAVQETIDLALKAEDPRVRTVNLGVLLDRVLGKPTELPGDGEDRLADIADLTPEQRQELSEALETVFRLTGRGPGALVIEATD